MNFPPQHFQNWHNPGAADTKCCCCCAAAEKCLRWTIRESRLPRKKCTHKIPLDTAEKLKALTYNAKNQLFKNCKKKSPDVVPTSVRWKFGML